MAQLAVIAAIAAIGGAFVSAGASVYAGQQAQKAYNAEADNLDLSAGRADLAAKNEFAAAQRDAKQKALEGELILSKQQAYAAASGGGAGSDAPTIVKIMRDTKQGTFYNTQTVMYQGEQRAQDYRNAATDLRASAVAKRETGRNAFVGGILDGIGGALGGVGSAIPKF